MPLCTRPATIRSAFGAVVGRDRSQSPDRGPSAERRVGRAHGSRPQALSGSVALAALGASSWSTRLGEPVLVARGRPAAVDDEQPVHLGRHERVDDVGGVASSQPGPQRPARASERAIAPWPSLRLAGSRRAARRRRDPSCRADEDAIDRRCSASSPGRRCRRTRELVLGSGSARSDRTGGRSANGTASSSPAMETSSRALRIPRFDENSRYTVAGGTSARSLMASIVVAP